METISSTALPSVAFRSAPIVDPAFSANASVAYARTEANGIIAMKLRKKVQVCDHCIAPHRIPRGTNIRRIFRGEDERTYLQSVTAELHQEEPPLALWPLVPSRGVVESGIGLVCYSVLCKGLVHIYLLVEIIFSGTIVIYSAMNPVLWR